MHALLVVSVSAVCAALVGSTAQAAVSSREYRVYIGTYTGQKSKGIYTARFDAATGTLGDPELAATTQSPSFLAVHPNGQFLYAVGESASIGPKREGSVTAYKIEPRSGKLQELSQQPSGGNGPCHLSVTPSGKCVLVANYGSGSIAAFPVLDSGSLDPASSTIQHSGSSADQRRQTGPHAHFITPDPSGTFALVCDLGLDKVLVYRLGEQPCTLRPNDPPSASVQAGAGPRHLAMHPNKKLLFVLNEMGCSVTIFNYDARKGTLTPIRAVRTLPEDFHGESSGAEIQVHPSGKFVYASNRGHDSIVVFACDPKSGTLTPVQFAPTEGKTPRHFAIDPTGKWLIAENQDSDSIVVFRVDEKTGRLAPTGTKKEVGKPVCLVFSRG